MAIPDFQSFILPVLKLGAKKATQLNEAVKILADEFGLTQEERAQLLPSGGITTVKGRVGWAVTYLVKAKLLIRPKRGYFTATERGKAALSKPSAKIDCKFLEQYQEFREFKTHKSPSAPLATSDTGTDESETPEERIEHAYAEVAAAIKAELLSKVQQASPEFFEQLIVKLLISMGYGGLDEEAGKHLGKSGDGGVDGVINEDKLGLDQIYFQAKRYASDHPISRSDVQAFVGSLANKATANKGVFVTTSSFSRQTREYAKSVPVSIILIDGEKLTDLMFKYNVGVQINRSIELKKIDEDFFLE
ncbi:MAG: Mrr restriction system protein [Verrucomicrobia subdivision 3 bacterium]|nr:Mrr restriction system protein [Limisphaerales bacterium]MCS1414094.1 Mrr restriction system protein [Limisphaerales bacterium]